MAKAKTSAPTSLYRNRRSFAKIPDVMDVPNLIAIQTDSFKWFKEEGLQQAFQDIAPIENSTKDMCVEFGKHEFGEPKYTVDECKEKDVSYQAPLFVEIRFINRETGEIKEQNVFMGDFPLMTNRGTFIINGTERVVVSQLVRSPGVYFSSERDKTSDKTIYNAKVIPSRGAWLEFETDKRDILSVRIDRKRKQPATLLVRALGLAETREEIIDLLGSDEMVLRTLDRMHEIIPGAHCEGEVLLEGKNLYDKDVDPVAVRRDVGMVFQRPNPFPTMNIYDNVHPRERAGRREAQQPQDLQVRRG